MKVYHCRLKDVEVIFLLQKCNEAIQEYRYGIKMFECNINGCPGWSQTATVHGTCCSFNYFPLAKERASVLNQAGNLGGMNILFGGKNATAEGAFDSKTSITGLNLIISEPGSFITLSSEMFSLTADFDNYFRIYLSNDAVSSDYESLPLKLRQCFLSRDMHTNTIASRSRCTLVCTMEITHRECGCHPYHLPFITHTSKTIRNCTINDLNCIRSKTGER